MSTFTSGLRVLDVGTGSGVLAVTLALEMQDLTVDAVEVSADALAVARLNIAVHGVERSVNLIQADMAHGLTRTYDAIAANLPYVPHAVLDELDPEVSAWEPRLALDGGSDGLVLVRRLINQAGLLLHPGGCLVIEVGAGQHEDVNAALTSSPAWTEVSVRDDLAGIPRVVSARAVRI